MQRLQSVAKLVATEMTLRDVVVYEQTRFASTKRALIVVTGRVAAGIDLEHGADVRIDSVDARHHGDAAAGGGDERRRAEREDVRRVFGLAQPVPPRGPRPDPADGARAAHDGGTRVGDPHARGSERGRKCSPNCSAAMAIAWRSCGLSSSIGRQASWRRRTIVRPRCRTVALPLISPARLLQQRDEEGQRVEQQPPAPRQADHEHRPIHAPADDEEHREQQRDGGEHDLARVERRDAMLVGDACSRAYRHHDGGHEQTSSRPRRPPYRARAAGVTRRAAPRRSGRRMTARTGRRTCERVRCAAPSRS